MWISRHTNESVHLKACVFCRLQLTLRSQIKLEIVCVLVLFVHFVLCAVHISKMNKLGIFWPLVIILLKMQVAGFLIWLQLFSFAQMAKADKMNAGAIVM